MDQEILLEQIISYTIGASEMIPDIAKRAGQDYQIAILPNGPHFYTGILQSAGYLLLPQRKKLLLIMEQSEDTKEIYQITGTFGPILGKQRTLHEDKLDHQKNKGSEIFLDARVIPTTGETVGTNKVKGSQISKAVVYKDGRKTEFQPSIQDLGVVVNHLAYMHTIGKIKEVACLAVGINISPAKQKKLNDYLCAVGSDTNIVFLSNITVPSATTNFPTSKLFKTNTGLLVKTFQSLNKKLKRSSEIIAYAHGDKKGKSGYACILG